MLVDFLKYKEAKLDLDCIKRRVEKERLKGWKPFLEWKEAELSAQRVLNNLKNVA